MLPTTSALSGGLRVVLGTLGVTFDVDATCPVSLPLPGGVTGLRSASSWTPPEDLSPPTRADIGSGQDCGHGRGVWSAHEKISASLVGSPCVFVTPEPTDPDDTLECSRGVSIYNYAKPRQNKPGRPVQQFLFL